MKTHEKLSSVFRTLQLAMIALIILDCTNWVLLVVWTIANIIDACIDCAIKEERQ